MKKILLFILLSACQFSFSQNVPKRHLPYNVDSMAYVFRDIADKTLSHFSNEFGKKIVYIYAKHRRSYGLYIFLETKTYEEYKEFLVEVDEYGKIIEMQEKRRYLELSRLEDKKRLNRREKKRLETLKFTRQFIIEEVFDPNNYHRGFITDFEDNTILELVCGGVRRQSYFVMKDENDSLYGEIFCGDNKSGIPLNEKLKAYIYASLYVDGW